MKCVIRQPFSYAHDGVRTRFLETDQVHEIRDDLVPGLEKAGFVAKAKARAILTTPEPEPAPAPEPEEAAADAKGDAAKDKGAAAGAA